MPENTDKRYPFKFLNSYDRNDADIFFGRDEEIKAMYEMVFQNSMVLVYGASGTGKTSLIQCGLASKFKSYDWLPLIIRRGSNINESLKKALEAAGGNSENFDDEIADANQKELTPLAKLIKGVYLSNFKTTYLIFDQFEELYIIDNKDKDKDEEDKFIAAIKEILTAEQPVKIIFSIREEYLGYLYHFEKEVPQLLRKKLRLEPMTTDDLTDVLNRINKVKNSLVTVKANEVKDISEGIFEKLRGENRTLTIDLPYLQVFLDNLYFEITKDKTHTTDAVITLDSITRMGDIGDVLKKFLEDQVEDIRNAAIKNNIAGNSVSAKMIWTILSPFATLEGTKDPLVKNDIEARIYNNTISESLIHFSIEEFTKRRILNYAEETERYELAHDSLAKCIAGKRTDEDIKLLEIRRLINHQVSIKEGTREFFTEKQLKSINPYLDKLKLSDDEKKLVEESKNAMAVQVNKRKKRLYLSVAATLLAIVLVVGLLYHQKQVQAENDRINKLDQFKVQIKNITPDGNFLLGFLYTVEALALEKDKNEYDSIIKNAIKNHFFPSYFLDNSFLDSNKIQQSAFGPKDTTIYTFSDSIVTEWSLKTGEKIYSVNKIKDTVTKDISLQGSFIELKKKIIDSLAKDDIGLPIYGGHVLTIIGASYSKDTMRVITWGKNAESVWDAIDFWTNDGFAEPIPSLIHDGIKGAIFNADNSMILTWNDSTARVWRSINDSAIFQLPVDIIKLKAQVETGVELSPADNTTILIIPPLEYARRREAFLKLYEEYLEKGKKK